jgi:hypothetical protein
MAHIIQRDEVGTTIRIKNGIKYSPYHWKLEETEIKEI